MKAWFVGPLPSGQTCACVGCSRADKLERDKSGVWRSHLCIVPRSWLRPLVVAILLTASTARADVFDALAISGAASDVVTTEVALRRGFVESNLGNRYVRVGANVALTGAMLLAAREADKAGHKNMAKVVKVATFLTWGYIGYHNVRTMQRGVTP